MAYPDTDDRGASGPGPVPGSGEPDVKDDKDAVKPHQRILRSKGFIPTVVVVTLVVFVLLSPRMAGSPPRLESITPPRGKPGDVMILTGRNFGNPRETAEVRISGISPTSQDYTEWTDTRISVRIPDEATSGIVYVLTKSGRSGGLLFISQSDIPQPATGASRPGDPYIVNKDNPIQPSAARVGDDHDDKHNISCYLKSCKKSSVMKLPVPVANHLFFSFIPVCKKLLDSDIGEGMFCQLGNDLKRNCGNIRTDKGCIQDVLRTPDACDDDLALVAIIVIDGDDILNQIHARVADIIQAADKGTDVGGSGLRGQKRLRGRKYQGDIGFNALRREFLHRLEPFDDHRNLDDDILGKLSQLARLGQHPLGLKTHNLSAYRTVDDLANLDDNLFKWLTFSGY